MQATKTTPLSVTEYATLLDRAVRSAGPAVIEGEVQKETLTQGGHIFFDLTDGESKLLCKVWCPEVPRLQHRPKTGDLVLVKVQRADVYKPQGALGLVVRDVRLAGDGLLLQRRAELIEKLSTQGLCDPARLRPLPRFPRAVGVISGKGSSGMADVVRAVHARFPPAHIVACEPLVQGTAAPAQIIEALGRLMRHPTVDVILIARGGGSVQELSCFDDEHLCLAISACTKPVVCAIGHTTDDPVCNHVSHPAATPTHAPELVVPSAAELKQEIALARQSLANVPARIERKTERLDAFQARLDPVRRIDARDVTIRERSEAIQGSEHAFFAERERSLVETRAAILSIPRRLPSTSEVMALAAKLDRRAQAFFADRSRELAETRRRLDQTSAHIATERRQLAETSRRLGVGIRRQLADHDYDYRRALARFVRETSEGIERRLAHDRDRLAQPHDRLRERIGRRLADVDRDQRLVATRIDARDPRRHGYVLASDTDGTPVRSVARLHRRARLNLNFLDGQAVTIIDDIKERHDE